MIRRELEKDPTLAAESWDRFLPAFKKQNNQRPKKKAKEKKQYTPFPPAPMPRKVDEQLESGEYFLSDQAKKARALDTRQAKQEEGAAAKKEQREERFKAPKEAKPAKAKAGGGDAAGAGASSEPSAFDLAKSLKKGGAGAKRARSADAVVDGAEAAAKAREAERERLLPDAKKTKRALKDKLQKAKGLKK